MTHEYFFELLAEEIPAWMLSARIEMVRTELAKLVRSSFDLDLSGDDLVVDATSRRLFFRIRGLPASQADREEEVKGPPRKMAFDAGGAPTKALLGFLKKNDASLEDVEPGGGDYIRIRRTVKGREAADILRTDVPRIIEGLRWPKMMRWGRGEHSYIRPIHSVISIFAGKLMPISIFDTDAGTTTVGHRILSNHPIEVASYEDYVKKLAAAHVVVRADERVRIMRERAKQLASEVGGTPASDETIWEQWQFLTECPNLIRAEFNRDFLILPEEVLVTVMRVHQKQLPIQAKDRLTSSFLAVIDQTGDPDGNAASGNAFVSNARFADARFFYETDRRKKLADRMPELSHLQFQEKLGSYEGKCDRLERLAAAIAHATRRDEIQAAAAARLAKTDLVTEMVKEFTDLQGKVGGIYAREEGLPEPIWQAIYDHYLPVNIEDPLPRGEAGAIVSAADRIDTLAGFFMIGLVPTGSKDPFALRRAAQGLVLILLNRASWQIDMSVEHLIDLALETYGASASAANETRSALLEFFAERVRTILENAPFSLAYDEVAAAMEAGWANSLTDLHDRTLALREVRNKPDFLSLLDSAKRIVNITAGTETEAVDAALLSEPAEIRLDALAGTVGEQIDELTSLRKYRAALESFAALSGELEKFFVDVLVNVEDERVRTNRMALLKKVGGLVRRIGDVTKIVVDRKDYTPSR